MMHTSRVARACLAFALLVPAGSRLHAQSLEGSKWSIEQEGSETAVLWWLGSQGRVRNGDVGTILAGYKWHQAGDSVIVTIGDTVRYAGVVMNNRLVGIRTGRRRSQASRDRSAEHAGAAGLHSDAAARCRGGG